MLGLTTEWRFGDDVQSPENSLTLDDYKTVTWDSLVVNWNFLNGRLISKCHLTCNVIMI